MKFSLKIKSILALLVIAFALSGVAVYIGYRIYSDTMDKRYEASSMDLAQTAAALMDAEKVREYSEEMMEIYRQNPAPEFQNAQEEADYYALYAEVPDADYQNMFRTLQAIKKNNQEIEYLYLFTLDADSRTGVYVLDADTSESACPMGTWDIIYPENYEIFERPERGFPAYITKTAEFGWLCSAGAPITAEDGSVVGYAMIEINMNDVMADRESFLKSIALSMVVVTFLLVVIFIFLVNRTVVLPINHLAVAASSFVSEKNKTQPGASALSQLHIHTGDEIEALYQSIKQMEIDIDQYIHRISRITAEKERIGAELNVATQIQADMLPRIFPAFPERKEFDIYATMNPAKEVGGDFYDFFLVDEDHLAVVIADVSGKGVPAALFMVIAKTLIKNHAQNREAPGEVFTQTNEQLCEGNDAGLFVTAWMGVLEISTGQFIYVNAGHNPPLLRHEGGRFEWLKSRPGFVLAGMEGVRYRENVMQMEQGDCLYLYTDGVTEATDGKQELFGEERLLAALNEQPELPVQELLSKMKRDIDSFVGEAEQFDDITMLGLYYREKKGDKMTEKVFPAALEQLEAVQEFIAEQIEGHSCPSKVKFQLDVAIEEIFVNIAHYAYPPDKPGTAVVRCRLDGDPLQATIQFLDSGKPFNPLEKQEADTTLSAEERGVGGLGILMVKKSMDAVEYAYENGKNILTIRKYIHVD